MIHVLDHQTDRILGTLENKPNSALFWNDIHRQLLKNNEETFDFTMQANVPESEYFSKRNRVVIPDEDGYFIEFIIGWTDQFSDKTKEIRTLASYTELAKQKILDPIVLEGQTVETALDHILNGTEWRRGTTEFSGTRKIEFTEHTDALRALREVATIFELELRFRVEVKANRITGRFVDLIQRVGEITKKEIVFGKDLIGVTRKEDSTNIVTAMIGLGPAREDGTRLIVRVEDEEALQRWGRNGRHLWGVHEPTTEDSNMIEARLRQLTEAQLKKQINTVVEYEVQQASIEHIFGYEHEKVRLGDTNRVKDTSFSPPLYLDARIISVERSISDKSRKQFVLGDFIEYSEEDIMATFRALKAALNKKASQGDIQAVMEYAEQVAEGSERKIPVQPTPPEDPQVGDKWLDTSKPIPILKVFEDDEWKKAQPTEPTDIGAVSEEDVLLKDQNYNGFKWNDTDGLIVERSDGKVRSLLNGTDGIKVQVKKGANWVDMFYVDIQGKVIFAGNMEGGSIKSNTTIDVTTDLRVGENINVTSKIEGNPTGVNFMWPTGLGQYGHIHERGYILDIFDEGIINVLGLQRVSIDSAYGDVELNGNRVLINGEHIQHGTVKGVSGQNSVTFTFPKAFSKPPSVIPQLRSLSGQFVNYFVYQVTNTSCTIIYDTNNFNPNAWFWWVAIG